MSETPAQPSQTPLIFQIDSSPNIADLVEALSIAQGEFPVIPKDSEVSVYSKPPERKFLYSYKYADLTTIIDCTRPALSKNGLSFTQDYVKHPILNVGVVTILFHKTGQWLKTGFVPCPIQGMDMKGVAGQFTYGKRISLTAALGISADEDMDAGSIEAQQSNSTEKNDHKKQASPPAKPKEPTPLDQLMKVVKQAGINNALMPQIIKMVIGEKRKSTELAPIEIQQVIDHIIEMYINKKGQK